MNKDRLRKECVKAGKSLYKMLPIILAVLLILSLINTLVPKSFYTSFFQGNLFLDPLIGGVFGSISAGTPITSYIIGGELLSQGVSLIAITAFIVAWVTVGIVQLRIEITFLGKKFAIVRNILAFIFSILVAIATAAIISII